MISAHTYCLRLLVLLGLWVALPGRVVAADISVSAALSRYSVEVGESAQLEISIEGGRGQTQPPEVDVDGLEVHYRGPSTSQKLAFGNGPATYQITTTHVYQVTPQRAGSFTIPALSVNVGGKVYTTQPIILKVEKATAAGGSADNDKIAFAEIKIQKRTA